MRRSIPFRGLTVRSWVVAVSMALGGLPPGLAASVDLSPSQVVQAAVSDVLTDMRANAALYETEPTRLYDLANRKVLPHFDFSRMTQLSMGKHWRSASETQKTAVGEAFQEHFVATYSKQLFNYRNTDPVIESEPGATEKTAVLKASVRNQRGEDVTLFLRLERRADRWRIIDVTVEGVSYLVTNRGQFSEVIANKGIDGLIQSLREATKRIRDESSGQR